MNNSVVITTNIYNILKNTRLFSGIDLQEFLSLADALNIHQKTYHKNSLIFAQSSNVHHIYIVLRGKVIIYQENADGSQLLINEISPLDSFGEAIAASNQIAPYWATTLEETTLCYLDFNHIIQPSNNVAHNKLLANTFKVLANKVLQINNRLQIIAQKKIKDKLLFFLNQQKTQQNKNPFTIPYNRQQLADYLLVDRSALSYVLMQLKEQGIIDYHKNKFTLLIKLSEQL